MEEEDIREPFLSSDKDDFQIDSDIDKQISQKMRSGFIVKVFGIIFYQICITAIVISLGLFNNSFTNILLKSSALYITCFISTFVLVLLPLCVPGAFNKVPLNYIILTLFTLSYSYLLAVLTCLYKPQSVLTTLFLTLVVVGALILYAMKTKEDFSTCGGMLCVFLILLILSSLILIFIPVPFLYLIYNILGLVLFSFYLIFDVQLLMGDRKVKFTEDDYILAAMSIYLDIVYIFVKLLQLFGDHN